MFRSGVVGQSQASRSVRRVASCTPADLAERPFVDDMRRRARLGMHEAGAKLALGVLTGLYRCRDPRDGTVLAYAGTDTPQELAAWVVSDAAKAGLDLSPADVAAACPGWERLA